MLLFLYLILYMLLLLGTREQQRSGFWAQHRMDTVFVLSLISR